MLLHDKLTISLFRLPIVNKLVPFEPFAVRTVKCFSVLTYGPQDWISRVAVKSHRHVSQSELLIMFQYLYLILCCGLLWRLKNHWPRNFLDFWRLKQNCIGCGVLYYLVRWLLRSCENSFCVNFCVEASLCVGLYVTCFSLGAVRVSGVSVACCHSFLLMNQQFQFVPQAVNGEVSIELSGQ
jgi:hypothetical protein